MADKAKNFRVATGKVAKGSKETRQKFDVVSALLERNVDPKSIAA